MSKIIKNRSGELIGSGMSAAFLKEKVDLAHCRGYAVLIERVTSADEPDEKAVYNLYQMDFNEAKASREMHEACKAQHEAIDLLFARLIQIDPTFFPSKIGKPWEAVVLGNAAIKMAESAKQ